MAGMRSWRNDVATAIAGSQARKLEFGSVLPAGAFPMRRKAVASAEPEDALLTGMTRSLDRRLLALNLKPALAVAIPVLKVA